MVQANGALSEIAINGAGKRYLDDFTLLSTQIRYCGHVPVRGLGLDRRSLAAAFDARVVPA